MDTQVQSILNRIQNDFATHTKSILPAPSKLDTESIISAGVVLVGFWLASLLVKKVAEKFFAARKIDETLARFLIRVMRISLIGLGVVTSLGTLGVDVSAIVAGLGLTGVALGIAMKDVVANAFSGIMLLVFRPFRHRDRIKVADFEGLVCDIDLRYTHLRAEGRTIFVPNSMMFANAVSVIASAVPAVESASSSKTMSLPNEHLDEPRPEPSVDEEPPGRPALHLERPNPLMALAEDRERIAA